jgi:hypothetical protein
MEITGRIETNPIFDRPLCRNDSPSGGQSETSSERTIGLSQSSESKNHVNVSMRWLFGPGNFLAAQFNNGMDADQPPRGLQFLS